MQNAGLRGLRIGKPRQACEDARGDRATGWQQQQHINIHPSLKSSGSGAVLNTSASG